eukprot:jgi/Psemu1/52520/gm1.52520_g
MKVASSTLALVTLGLSSSPLFSHGSKAPIDPYELLSAGQPYGEVFTLEPFSAKVYYEAKTGAKILTDVYSNVTAGSPCSSGTNITNINTTLIASGPAYNTTTSDGNINSVQLTTADIKSTGAYMAVGANDGKVNLCVRSYLTADYDSSSAGDEVVSFVDTQLELNVDFTAKFQNFTQEVNITATTSKNFTQNITKNVEVESFLCASGSNATTSYKIGQDFSVCVRPTLEFSSKGYSIDGFVNVTCENSAASRALVNNSNPDALTAVKKAPAVSGYLDGAGQMAGGAAGAFESVVTAGYFSSNENSFTCSGDASLKYTPAVCTKSAIAQATREATSVLYAGICLKGYNSTGVTLERKIEATDNTTFTDISQATKIVPLLKYYNASQYDHTAFHNDTSENGFCGPNDSFFPPERNLREYAYWIMKSVEFKFILNPDYAGTTVEICVLGTKTAPDFGQEWNLTNMTAAPGETLIQGQTITHLHWWCVQEKYNVNEDVCDYPKSGRKLETVSFRDTYGFSRSVQDASSTSASPFAAKIGLNSEGTEAITASSAVIYDGLVSIAMFGVSLFFILCDVM